MSALPTDSREHTERRADYFDELRAELGPFWLFWVMSWPLILAVGIWLALPA